MRFDVNVSNAYAASEERLTGELADFVDADGAPRADVVRARALVGSLPLVTIAELLGAPSAVVEVDIAGSVGEDGETDAITITARVVAGAPVAAEDLEEVDR